jgi:hypothetical protein
MERKDQMNAIVNRRGFIGIVGGAFSSLFPMFRKSPRVEASVSEPARVSLDDKIKYYFDEHPEAADAFGLDKLEDTRDVAEPITNVASFAGSEPEPVLARPTKKSDKEILLDEEGWVKDDIIDRIGEPIFDEDGCWKTYAQGELTDEEIAAYRRYFNHDYEDEVTEAAPVGSDIDGRENAVPSSSQPGEDSKESSVSRQTGDVALAA